ncbi:Ig-like domain-containing protein [Desertivirga xinjiangensis]|uniref:Ig-like domain-containing protein n=1 Tax=Desertivirga xinjiangensis TaxID=539206 RepID=UPI00210BDED8|nr:Ig-like domain-containing protein [Pedobacter xinjiangensis]
MKKYLLGNFLMICLMLVCEQVRSQAYNWNQVRIGGGGNVTSFKTHPLVPNLFFITTDVGTPYRWNHNTQRWEEMMLFNKIPLVYWNWEFNQRCGDLAIDPNDPTGNILYATVENGAGVAPGKGDSKKGTVMRSADRGQTWVDMGLAVSIKPNEDQSISDRLVVDPQNSNVIYLTTRENGTFRNDSANVPGSAWHKLNTPGISDKFSYVNSKGETVILPQTRFIAIDKTKGMINGRSKYVYLGGPDGVYLSTDGGNNFAKMSGSPGEPRRVSLANDGVMYVNRFKASAVRSTGGRGLWRWDGNNWSEVSPIADSVWAAFAVNPLNSQELIVSTAGSWNSDFAYRSNAGGAAGSWGSRMTITRDNSEAPHSKNDNVSSGNIGHNLNTFVFDPHNPGHVWFVDMLDVGQTTNVWAPIVNWKLRDAGLEELVVTGPLVAPSSGKNLLLSATADIGGADHRSLTEPPQKGVNTWISANRGANNTGSAYQETNPNFIVRVGSNGWDGPGVGGYSTNGGDSYTQFPTPPSSMVRGRVAVSATSETIVWVPMGSGAPRYSTNRGTSWTICAGAPTEVIKGANQFDVYAGQNPLTADKVIGNKFYIYKQGAIYVSVDGGANFTQYANVLPSVGPGAGYFTLESTPGKANDLWFSSFNHGLFHSSDGGQSFSRVNTSFVTNPYWFAIGKADSTAANNILFIGSEAKAIDGKFYALFRSDDDGASWTTIANPAPGVIKTMAADRNGRLFLGVTGNGIFVGEPTLGPVTGINITGPADSVVVADSLKLKANLTPAFPDDNTIVWSSSDTSKAIVDAYGIVHALAEGNVVIRATAASNVYAEYTIRVRPVVHPDSVVVDPVMYLGLGMTTNVEARVFPVNTTNKTTIWTSSNSAVASVTSAGLIKANATGTTIITATTQDGAKTASSELIISNTAKATNAGGPATGKFAPENPGEPYTTNSIWVTTTGTAVSTAGAIDPAPATLYQSQRLGGANFTYTYSGLVPSANYTIRLHFAEIVPNMITGSRIFHVTTGLSTDTLLKNFDIYAAAGGRYKAIVREFVRQSDAGGVLKLTFRKKTSYPAINGMELLMTPVAGINIGQDSAGVGINDTTTLSKTILPAGATNTAVNWRSSDNTIVTVDAAGKITGKAPGLAWIYATTQESQFTDSIKINSFHIPVSSVALNRTSDTVGVKNTISLSATVLPSNASNKKVIWHSSDTTIVKVNQNGVITGVSPGIASISAITEDLGLTATSSIRAENILVDTLVVTRYQSTLGVNDTTTFRAKVQPTNASLQTFTWLSSDTTKAKVNQNGLVTAIAPGSVIISARADDEGATETSNSLNILPLEQCGILTNQGFESGFFNWLRYQNGSPSSTAVTTTQSEVHSGYRAAELRGTSASINYYTNPPLTAGSTFTLKVWAKIGSTPLASNPAVAEFPDWAGIGLDCLDSTGAKIPGTAQQIVLHNRPENRLNYAEYTISGTAPAGTAKLGFWATKSNQRGRLLLDDFCLTTSVPVNGISIDPASASEYEGVSKQFTAAVLPSNAINKKVNWSSLNPSIASVDSTGLVTGITAGIAHIVATTQDGGFTDTATYTVISTRLMAVDAGATSATNGFSADQYYGGGSTSTSTSSILVDTSGTSLQVPPSIYQSKRYGVNFRYLLTGFTPGANYKIRLYFTESYWNAPNKRVFSVSVNSIAKINNLDIFAETGGMNHALVREITASADSIGRLNIGFARSKDNAIISAIEVFMVPSENMLLSTSALSTTRASALVPNHLKPAKEITLMKKVIVYPNPVSERTLHVRLTGFESGRKVRFVLINISTGQDVIRSEANLTGEETTDIPIDLPPLLQGAYNLKVISGNDVFNSKVIVR